MTEKAYESVTFGEAGTGVLEIPKVAIEGIWRFSEMSNSNLGNSFASHLRSIFLLSGGSLRIGLSIIAIISFSGYIATQPTVEKKSKSFLISTLATYIISIIILGLTGIWSHHLQLIYFSQTLILIYIAINFKPKKAFINSSFGIAFVVLAILLSGTLRLTHYVVSPQEIITKISSLTQEPPQTRAFRAIYPNGAAFARLGLNTYIIPYGAANDKLLCPDFAQYPFYSRERLDNILTCIKTSPTLIVDESFSLHHSRVSVLPRDAERKIIMENWNNFVTEGEKIITTQYSCKKLGTVRICNTDKIKLIPFVSL
ncbi:hypothetical protein [Planktothrix tepida]|uniref:hypothetical protein n=2 Tax=Planktothrix tepida TaxID=1678309 RepID=UPI0020B3E941|nr:hypothetical protein [Planktothrix tepida]